MNAFIAAILSLAALCSIVGAGNSLANVVIVIIHDGIHYTTMKCNQ